MSHSSDGNPVISRPAFFGVRRAIARCPPTVHDFPAEIFFAASARRRAFWEFVVKVLSGH
jgi:hypothetical protein